MNLYFLLIACLQLWSLITPVDPASTWVPLGFIFAVSAIKEAIDDLSRYIQCSSIHDASLLLLQLSRCYTFLFVFVNPCFFVRARRDRIANSRPFTIYKSGMQKRVLTHCSRDLSWALIYCSLICLCSSVALFALSWFLDSLEGHSRG